MVRYVLLCGSSYAEFTRFDEAFLVLCGDCFSDVVSLILADIVVLDSVPCAKLFGCHSSDAATKVCACQVLFNYERVSAYPLRCICPTLLRYWSLLTRMLGWTTSRYNRSCSHPVGRNPHAFTRCGVDPYTRLAGIGPEAACDEFELGTVCHWQ